jgi:hypothetical protein
LVRRDLVDPRIRLDETVNHRSTEQVRRQTKPHEALKNSEIHVYPYMFRRTIVQNIQITQLKIYA